MRAAPFDIVLTTLNARYKHASLGLRCLRANLGVWRERSVICEFVIGQKTEALVEQLLAHGPRMVALGVYIWNVDEATRLVAMLKRVAPDVVIVVGGPEVSHEVGEQRICQLADYVVTGWGDVTFARLVHSVLVGPRPLMKVHAGEQPPLESLQLPYSEFTDEDIAHRHIYVEASRGCPFKCAFCLSALDKTAWPFPLQSFLDALDALWVRGLRRFKFVDRTFNLKVATSTAILDFFLARLGGAPDDLPFLHFELIPDHLPDPLRERIVRFPPGTLQFEIGIQTFSPEVQALIARRQDNEAACANIRWLREATHAHLHVDLIAGLPGEDLDSFGAGFDRLVAAGPHEIQFGILKRLRGTPIIAHTNTYQLCFNPDAPYNILSTDRIDFATMQRLSRFARYWDLVGNSGRFVRTLPTLLGAQPFAHFLAFSDWVFEQAGQTVHIATERLFEWVYAFLVQRGVQDLDVCRTMLAADYVASGARGKLSFVDIAPLLQTRGSGARDQNTLAAFPRQKRHVQAAPI